ANTLGNNSCTCVYCLDMKRPSCRSLDSLNSTTGGFFISLSIFLHAVHVWSDIDFNKPVVHIHKTVTRLGKQKITKISDTPKSFSSIRYIPLSPRALSILKKLKSTAPNEWVFSGEEGVRITYDSVRSKMKTICKHAGVKYQPPHATRHTFTTNLFDAHVDPKVIQKILGHSDEETSKKIYKHLREDGFNQMYDAIMQIAQ
ncbi:MAG: site-specific integrase, partial [Clostridia bacterium]|nr:site-specific integrase [Clostridia bacterium]